jgi:hypothetical protein
MKVRQKMRKNYLSIYHQAKEKIMKSKEDLKLIKNFKRNFRLFPRFLRQDKVM